MSERPDARERPTSYAFFAVDLEGKVIEFNGACEQLLGFAAGDIVGDVACDRMFPEREREALNGELERVANDEPTTFIGHSQPISVLRADSSETRLELTCVPSGSEPMTITCLLRDVTEANGRAASVGASGGRIGTYEWDVTAGRGDASPELADIHGVSHADAKGSAEDYLALVHEDDRDAFVERMRAVLQANRVEPVSRWRIVRPDGETRHLLGSMASLEWDQGRLVKVSGTVEDVTDESMARTELALHTAVSEALADWNGPDGCALGLLRRVVEATGWRYGALWTVGEGAAALRCHACWAQPDEHAERYEGRRRSARFRLGQGLPGSAWSSDRVVAGKELRAQSLPVAQDRLGSFAFPVRHDSRFDGVLEFATGEEEPLTDGLRRTLRAVGLQLGDFFARHRGDLEDSPVSRREREVLQLAANGGTTDTIARELVLSASTVKSHFENSYAKLGAGDRAQAIAEAFRRGLIG